MGRLRSAPSADAVGQRGAGASTRWLITSVVLAPIAALVIFDAVLQRRTAAQLGERVAELEKRLQAYAKLEPRSGNFAWQEDAEARKQQKHAYEASNAFVDELFQESNRFPHGHNVSAWHEMLRRQTPAAFADEFNESAPDWCTDLEHIVLTEQELRQTPLSAASRERSLRSLTECGYIYLDNFFSRATVAAFREEYEAFRASPEAADFVYPCQGPGRVEHLLPFRPPFNDSTIYADPRLLTLLGDFLGEGIKMELQTVITSPPGSGHQRWHQGWRHLFHPDERLPPFAVVVALPLGDVTPEMGPTEMCPGHKRRFYHGWRCDANAIRLGSTSGTVVIFDYKLLHRGPANEHPSEERPMVSMVFSKHFFVNVEAFVNRGISLAASLHIRRYWEQFFWHPGDRKTQFAV